MTVKFFGIMIYLIFAALAAAEYKPTATKSWHSRIPRAKWPSPTEKWGDPPTEFPDESSSGSKFTIGIIMGIVVGCLVFIILVVLVVILIIRKRRHAASPLMGEDSKNNQEDIQEQLIK